MGRHDGFTIIEVLLYLAVTGLILLAVTTSFNRSISYNRFTDTNKSLEAYIEAYSAGVRSGEVGTATDGQGRAAACAQGGGSAFPGASDDCVIMGKLLKLDGGNGANKIRVYDVLGNIEAVTDPTSPCLKDQSDDTTKLLAAYCPRIRDTGQLVSEHELEWQATVKGSAFGDGSAVNSIAFLRDPGSERMYTVAQNLTWSDTGQVNILRSSSPAFVDKEGVICVAHETLSQVFSLVHFMPGQGESSIEMITDGSSIPAAIIRGAGC